MRNAGALSISSLDSRHWTYLAEGGKNIILRYEGPLKEPFASPSGGKLALRLSKVDRGSSSKIGNDSGNEFIEALDWRNSVLEPDLSSSTAGAILPPLLRLKDDPSDADTLRRFLKEMAAKIETMRPMERRRVSGIDETGGQGIIVMEDLSASISGKQVITFEVKPKCGFVPTSTAHLSRETASIKQRFSRYRMHRVLKSRSPPTIEDFDQYYDPLDLYSEDEERIRKAVKALYRDWGQGEGNLRIFLNGNRVQASDLALLNESVKDHFTSESVEGLLISLLTSNDARSILKKLVHLQQKYDDLDVEGVAALYQREKGVTLTEAKEPPITLSEYQEVVSGNAKGTVPPVRQSIVKLLLSAMYKDCSIFIRCISSDTPTFHLVDLDPKPVTKLAYFEQLDKDVIHNFRDWAQKVGLID